MSETPPRPPHALGPRVVGVGFDGAPSGNSDVELLPRLVRLLAEQMRESFEMLGREVRDGFARIERRIDAHDVIRAEHGKDIADLKKRVSTLEARAKTPKKKRT